MEMSCVFFLQRSFKKVQTDIIKSVPKARYRDYHSCVPSARGAPS